MAAALGLLRQAAMPPEHVATAVGREGPAPTPGADGPRHAHCDRGAAAGTTRRAELVSTGAGGGPGGGGDGRGGRGGGDSALRSGTVGGVRFANLTTASHPRADGEPKPPRVGGGTLKMRWMRSSKAQASAAGGACGDGAKAPDVAATAARHVAVASAPCVAGTGGHDGADGEGGSGDDDEPIEPTIAMRGGAASIWLGGMVSVSSGRAAPGSQAVLQQAERLHAHIAMGGTPRASMTHDLSGMLDSDGVAMGLHLQAHAERMKKVRA
eukprot:292985-Chlamydomonas_euryale.AAC.1